MAKKQPVGPSEIDNMVEAAREMMGPLVSMADRLQSTELDPDLDPLTLRESASALIACSRDMAHTAVMLLSSARQREVAKQIADLKSKKG